MGAAMNRFNSLRRPTLALVAVVGLGFARPAGADDSLPFRGRADAVITGAVPTPDGLLLTTSGTGRATHLGQFTREERILVGADGTFVGQVTFTAANGDRLDALIDGAFTSPTTAVATYTFAGGTGRFADATGSAAVAAVTPDGLHIALAFEGSIAF